MSKVSVVVPIYNAEKRLSKCISSIVNQTFRDFELLLINDGSIDTSLEICERYHKQDERIIVINKKENEGSILARRKGIEASSSNYIMFVDADDWIDKKIIEILYNETIKDNVDITVSNSYKVIGNNAIIKRTNKSIYFKEDKIFNMEEIKNELAVAYLHGHPFPASLFAKLYKRELLLNSGKYLDRLCFLGDDLFYNLEMFLKVNRVKIINKSLYYYRIGGFTSKYMPQLFNDMVNGYQIQKDVIEEYYQSTIQTRYNGISIMLLNTFKTCLINLLNSKLNVGEIKDLIRKYVSNKSIRESICNEGCKKYFPNSFLKAVEMKDVDYLYQFGINMYKKQKPKQLLFNFLMRFPLL